MNQQKSALVTGMYPDAFQGLEQLKAAIEKATRKSFAKNICLACENCFIAMRDEMFVENFCTITRNSMMNYNKENDPITECTYFILRNG